MLTHPFDVAKTIQQISLDLPPAQNGATEKLRMIKVFKGILRQEGLRGLFSGLVPRVAKVAPACGVMISSYEIGKRFFMDHYS